MNIRPNFSNSNSNPQERYYGPVPMPNQNYPQQNTQFINPQNSNRALGLREINRRIPSHEGSSWGSVEFRPQHVRFATQNKGEKVYILVRRHWASNVGWVYRNFMYSMLPPVVFGLIYYFKVDSDLINLKNVFLILMMYYSVIFTTVMKEFFDWYFDPYIVTNERVLDYDFKPFTSYTVQEAGLDKIEDVKEFAVGFLPSLFGYGDVHVQTASNAGLITFNQVDDPTRVRDIISDLANIAKTFKE